MNPLVRHFFVCQGFVGRVCSYTAVGLRGALLNYLLTLYE